MEWGVLLLVKCQASACNLLKLRLPHGCFSSFLNFTKSTKAREVLQMISKIFPELKVNVNINRDICRTLSNIYDGLFLHKLLVLFLLYWWLENCIFSEASNDLWKIAILRGGWSIKYVSKIFWETNISYHHIIRTCVYQEVGNVFFFRTFCVRPK